MFERPARREVLVTHPPGIHARPSVAIVTTVRRFGSKVQIRHNEQEADASDILQVLSLGIPHGAKVTLLARGPDAEQALNALVHLFADNFGVDHE